MDTPTRAEFNTSIDSLKELTNFRFDTIEAILSDNKYEVKKLDKRVDALERAGCPNTAKVRVLEDNSLSNTSIRKWIATSIALTSTILGVIVTILKITGIL